MAMTKEEIRRNSTLLIGGLFLSISMGSAKEKKGFQQKGLNKICEEALSHKMANSSINSRVYHISKMKEPCKQSLLKKAIYPSVHPRAPLRTDFTPPSKKDLYSLENLRTKYTSWGVDPIFRDSWINLSSAWGSFKKKREVVVAVIDTGIDPKHEYLQQNIHVLEGVKGKDNYGRDFSVLSRDKFAKNAKGRSPVDDHGHGTHVAGILRSVFPEVKIVPIKYYNPSRSGQDNLNSLIKSLEYAIKGGVDIINYSGGGPEPAIEELRILKQAERKGILVIAAAGNEKSNIDLKNKAFYPASYGLSNIVTVTAYNKQIVILKSSNWGGNSVDLAAPGHRIRSSVPKNQARDMTGTSQATAFVSGVAALIRAQHSTLSAQDIKIILRRSVKKILKLDKKCLSGGKLDATRALAVARKYILQQGPKKNIRRQERKISSLENMRSSP